MFTISYIIIFQIKSIFTERYYFHYKLFYKNTYHLRKDYVKSYIFYMKLNVGPIMSLHILNITRPTFFIFLYRKYLYGVCMFETYP